MNAKKCKALRKACSIVGNGLVPTLTFRTFFYTDLLGVQHPYRVVNSISWPEGSRRRIYQDAKKEM